MGVTAKQLLDLQCCDLTDPLGVGGEVFFSWRCCGFFQKSYRVQITDESGACVLDTGEIASDRPFTDRLIPPLRSSARYRWSVCVTDRQGERIQSGTAVFETALLEEKELAVPFITSEWENPVFMKTFTACAGETGRLYIAGLGYYDLFINGRRVADTYFQPVCSNYHDRDFVDMLYPFHDHMACSTYYNTYDISALLREGENRLVVILGNGFYNQHERVCEGKMAYGKPKLMVLCKLWGAGGERWLTTDLSWRVMAGPAERNNLFFGERYDARLAADWHHADGLPWEPVSFAPQRDTVLRPQLCPPDRVTQTIRPAYLWTRDGRMVYDAGENLSGLVRLRCHAPAGQAITLRFAETLTADGALDFVTAGGDEQIQQDVYTADGTPDQIYAPRFCWHGFRYFDIDTPVDELEVLKIHADLASWGEFACADGRLNVIVEATKRALLANMHGGVVSDCPHRERLGYTGDGQQALPASLLLLDGRTFYTKWMQDIADCQCRESGHIQHTAPFFGGGGGPGGWGCAVIFVPYYYYCHTGDTAMLKTYFSAMERWMGYLADHSEGYLVVREEEGGWCLGDWCFPFDDIRLSEAFVNSCYYGHCAGLMAEIARLAGCGEKAPGYEVLAGQIRQAVMERYYDPDTALFDGEPQGYVFARFLGLQVPQALERTLQHYRERPWLDTALFGTPLLLETLRDNGELELALRLLCRPEGPSFQYLFDGSHTTLWESCIGGSHNHPMFGRVASFLIRTLLGLPDHLEARHLVIRPMLPAGLASARGSTTVADGRLAVEWQRRGDSVLFTVEVPWNRTAELVAGGQTYPLACGLNSIAVASSAL